jgi:hypothetical protein
VASAKLAYSFPSQNNILSEACFNAGQQQEECYDLLNVINPRNKFVLSEDFLTLPKFQPAASPSSTNYFSRRA